MLSEREMPTTLDYFDLYIDVMKMYVMEGVCEKRNIRRSNCVFMIFLSNDCQSRDITADQIISFLKLQLTGFIKGEDSHFLLYCPI